jgi:hypothetical protein
MAPRVGRRSQTIPLAVCAAAVMFAGSLYLGLGVGTAIQEFAPTEPPPRATIAGSSFVSPASSNAVPAGAGAADQRPQQGSGATMPRNPSDALVVIHPRDPPKEPRLKGKDLPNGGPGLLLTIPAWADVHTKFIRPPTEKEPIDTIWDVAVLGCISATAAAKEAGAPQTTTALLQAFTAALGRVRLAAIACVEKGAISDDDGRISPEEIAEALWKRAPAWRLRKVVTVDNNTGCSTFVVERRERLFVFAITGGNDGRAAYVERTWGRRTPIQWYGDLWDPLLRSIVDLHPKYVEQKFDWLTFKISRIWQRVWEDFGQLATRRALASSLDGMSEAHRGLLKGLERQVGGARGIEYDWYVRLWDDNYFYEENMHQALIHFNPATPVMVGKMGWRNMAKAAVYPFAGGGAGWYLSAAGMERLGPSIADAEDWFVQFRARRDIFLPHSIHDEDVFLSAWLAILNVSFKNIPGVEHVSPGLNNKQRCMNEATLTKLRWDPGYSVYFNYPGKEEVLRIEEAVYAYFKPIIWHYMSPTRLVKLETLLYPERAADFKDEKLPTTNSDAVKRGKACYPGVPPGEAPARGKSLFETPVTDPPVVVERG